MKCDNIEQADFLDGKAEMKVGLMVLFLRMRNPLSKQMKMVQELDKHGKSIFSHAIILI